MQSTHKISNINSIKEVYNYLTSDTTIYFDLDNTLVTTEDDFGGEHWESRLAEELINRGLQEHIAIERACFIWSSVQSVTRLSPSETDTLNVLNCLHAKGHCPVAVTSRSIELMQTTLQQLRRIGIYFSVNKREEMLLNLANGELGKWMEGIVFCNGNNKGKMLHSFFKSLDIYPKNVLFVDDKMKNLEEVGEVMTLLGIPFIGLLYDKFHRKNKGFTSDITIHYFAELFQNAEAKKFFLKGLN